MVKNIKDYSTIEMIETMDKDLDYLSKFYNELQFREPYNINLTTLRIMILKKMCDKYLEESKKVISSERYNDCIEMSDFLISSYSQITIKGDEEKVKEYIKNEEYKK